MKNILLFLIFAASVLCSCNKKPSQPKSSSSVNFYLGPFQNRTMPVVASSPVEDKEERNPTNQKISKEEEDSIFFAELEVKNSLGMKDRMDEILSEKYYSSLEEFQSSLTRFVVTDCVFSYDYNEDGRKDALYMIQGTDQSKMLPDQYDSTQIVNKNYRGLVLLLSDGNRYRIAMENDTCFYSEHEDGGVYFAPELELYIYDGGDLSVHYAHGRYGFWSFLFKYCNEDFRLSSEYSDESMSWITEALSKTYINYDSCFVERYDLINVDDVRDENIQAEPVYSHRRKSFEPLDTIFLSRIDKVF